VELWDWADSEGKNDRESSSSAMVYGARGEGSSDRNRFGVGSPSSWAPPFIGQGRGMSGQGMEASAGECASMVTSMHPLWEVKRGLHQEGR
jgi:hypothetical protein